MQLCKYFLHHASLFAGIYQKCQIKVLYLIQNQTKILELYLTTAFIIKNNKLRVRNG
jgi:hypothetical protein